MQDYGLAAAQRQYDNAEPPRYNRKPIHTCSLCSCGIYPGEQFFNAGNEAAYCLTCVSWWTDTAEEEEYE